MTGLGDVGLALATGGTMDDVWRVLTLRDYNTRVVVIGTVLLGVAAGVVGTYMLLRKRALVGDALSHATLPGIVLAFFVMSAAGGTGKALPGLLAGAAITGLLGVGAIALVTRTTRVKQDAALGIVLSVFFGLGIAFLRVAQKMKTGNQAGLESFIYGKTASMVQADAIVLGVTALVTVVVCLALYKEFTLLSFDGAFARAQGWPVGVLDLIMMSLVTAVTVVGLQAVGLILIIALLVIPSAAARFWTDHLRTMLVVAAGIGALSGFVGAAISALAADMPAGAIIVVAASCAFVVSMLFGVRRGIAVRLVHELRMARSIARQHLLRALYEWQDAHRSAPIASPGHPPPATAVSPALPAAPMSATPTMFAAPPMPREALLAERSWSGPALRRAVRRAVAAGLVRPAPAGDGWLLTEAGRLDAARLVRNHRLWELFLITHADVAPSHVDRGADLIEHVLEPAMVRELEALLERERAGVPPSPHLLPVADVEPAPEPTS